jgi:hypothetical protein
MNRINTKSLRKRTKLIQLLFMLIMMKRMRNQNKNLWKDMKYLKIVNNLRKKKNLHLRVKGKTNELIKNKLIILIINKI